MRNDNAHKFIFAHLNKNSIGNKFELVKEQTKGNADVIIISKT